MVLFFHGHRLAPVPGESLARNAAQNENRSASSPKSVDQQIKPASGNSNGGAACSKSGKVAVKQVKANANNPATGGDNPPGNRKRKVI
jgi:hypothetical protein